MIIIWALCMIKCIVRIFQLFFQNFIKAAQRLGSHGPQIWLSYLIKKNVKGGCFLTKIAQHVYIIDVSIAKTWNIVVPSFFNGNINDAYIESYFCQKKDHLWHFTLSNKKIISGYHGYYSRLTNVKAYLLHCIVNNYIALLSLARMGTATSLLNCKLEL